MIRDSSYRTHHRPDTIIMFFCQKSKFFDKKLKMCQNTPESQWGVLTLYSVIKCVDILLYFLDVDWFTIPHQRTTGNIPIIDVH